MDPVGWLLQVVHEIKCKWTVPDIIYVILFSDYFRKTKQKWISEKNVVIILKVRRTDKEGMLVGDN